MGKFGFVILHYNALEDTIKCVESIFSNCKKDDVKIYVVDNASPNGSGKILSKKYSESPRVRVILSTENLGFAKGNNLGIECAVFDGYSDFVVVMNNDTKVIQENFCFLIEQEFTRSNFAVLGPTIYTPSGKTSVNPGRANIIDGKELKKNEARYRFRLFLWKMHLSVIIKVYQWLHKCISQKNEIVTSPCRTENCLLHGCCLIFSSLYLKKMSGFDPRTFLYFEEEILFAHCVGKNLKTVYLPELEIWHKEDGATDSVLPRQRQKEIFVISNILKSINVYKKILSEYGR